MENNETQYLNKENGPDEKEAFWATLSYIFFLLPLLSKYRKSEFVKYHFKQGFVWFFSLIAAYALSNFTARLYLKVIIYIVVFVLWCFGITYVLLGKKKPLPLIGWIALKLF